MNFTQFCEANGIMIDRPPRLGVWERYPTQTHPKKRNGAVKWMGQYGFCQDHAVHVEVQVWKEDGPVRIDSRVVYAAVRQAEEERKRLQENAAMRASMIVNKCVIGRHDYLRKKGFPDERGLIWCHDQTEHLVVPMYDGRSKLVGLQTIDAEGQKKFLYGQRTSGANFVFGTKGVTVLCEGYATGLSIREAARALKQNWRIVVCFSANNVVPISKALPVGIVVADNDTSGTGERIAKETGWRYWISDKAGEDFNDYHKRSGLHAAAQSLHALLYPSGGGSIRTQHRFIDAIATRKASDQLHSGMKNA